MRSLSSPVALALCLLHPSPSAPIPPQDSQRRAEYAKTVKARIDWEPTDPFHVFAVDVESAGFVIFGGERYGFAWDPAGGLRRWKQREE